MRVFPTRVGMVRGCCGLRGRGLSFPHPRGDGPGDDEAALDDTVFSPPAWGWSDAVHHLAERPRVFPTRVGMVRRPEVSRAGRGSFPHPRGDGPTFAWSCRKPAKFSPPAWGWSAIALASSRLMPVFPTRVGMVRRRRGSGPGRWRFPHPRGDGPRRSGCRAVRRRFSPPAWGWSDRHAPSLFNRSCFPHPRGDGPANRVNLSDGKVFSPPAWGWSAWPRPHRTRGGVFPTRVGMVRPSTRSLQ